MTYSEIEQFIKSNPKERIDSFISTLIDKSNHLENENTVLSLLMIVLIMAYYLTDGSLQIGPLSINVDNVKSYLPIIYSFIILRFVMLRAHVAEIKKIMRVISKEHFNHDNSKLDILYVDDITRLLLPLSMSDEVNKFNYKTKIGCIFSLLVIPVGIIPLIPCVFIVAWIYPQFQIFNSLDLINKISLIGTVWMLCLSMLYLLKTMSLAIKENK